jgi:outer membrane protein assembly factor BamA
MRKIPLYIIFILLAVLPVVAAECIVKTVRLEGSFNPDAAALYEGFRNEPCSALDAKDSELVEWHVNHGFPAVNVSWTLDSAGVATVRLNRGDAWVWAPPENHEKGKTRKDVFGKLSGLETGGLVSLSDLSRADDKLARSGYYERTMPVRVYRDPSRNRLVPVFSMADLQMNELEGYVTYASGDDGGWSGSILVQLYNIQGTARDLSISGETGDWEHSLDFSYKEPWILGTAWDGIARGSVEDDSSYKSALFEAGLRRNIGFDFTFSILGGIGDDEWTTALETSYRSEDRFILPRKGSRFDGSVTVHKKRTDSTDIRVSAYCSGRHLMPLYGNFILQTSFMAGTLLPTGKDYELEDLYSLGGINDIKGYRPGFFRSRAYGATEADLQWQGLPKTAFHLFFEPALHRARAPEHGWADTYSYGLGLTQYRESWSISLYYALHKGSDPLGGLLHFGVKSLF